MGDQLTIFQEEIDYTISDLVESAKNCTDCPLHSQENGGCAFYDGDPTSKVMIVAEAPGASEAWHGIPLIGKAGQLLNKALEGVGIDRRTLYLTNVCKHRPADNRTPTVEEQKTCSDKYLRKELDLIKPKLIVPLGNVPLQFFLGKNATISGYRGKWGKWNDSYVFPMFHPAYVLRNPSREPGSPAFLFWEDMQILKIAIDRMKKLGT